MNLVNETTLALTYAALEAEGKAALAEGKLERWYDEKLQSLADAAMNAPEGEDLESALVNLATHGPATFAVAWNMLAMSIIKERKGANG